ncbi:hypothetical protein [Oleiharenicola lentus]|uniref:hypothetical protein n=1 Tax=Oleiharenicola lentus TaxID=2508720 RepID=UPI003F66F165
MKSLLPVLFGVSLLGNVALAVFALRPTPAASSTNPAAPVTSSVEAASTPAAGANSPSERNAAVASGPIRTPRTHEEVRGIINALRAAGYPPAVLRAVADQMLRDLYPNPSVPPAGRYWKMADRTAETELARQAHRKEFNAARDAVLGADARPSAGMDAASKARSFGNLSDEKIDALVRLDEEYNNVRSLASASRENGTMSREQFEALQQQQQLILKEKSADLASLLTPQELEQYEMRTSQAANRVQNNLRKIDVSEEEYAALYQLQKTFEETTGQRNGGFSPDTMNQRQTAQLAMNEQTRTVLGDDRFFKYLESSDGNYGQVARFAATQPSVSQSTAYEVYKLQQEAQTAMMNATRNRGAGGVTDIQQTLQPYNDRLNQLLTPEVAEAYKKQGGGVFNAGRNLPRGAPSGAVMAFPLPGTN